MKKNITIITLIVAIFCLITYIFFHRCEIPVNVVLPGSQNSLYNNETELKQTIVITITEKNDLYINTANIIWYSLPSYIDSLTSDKAYNYKVVIYPHEKASLKKVIKIMSLAKERNLEVDLDEG